MKIINLTPHEITIVGEEGEVLHSFPPSGQLARCEVARETAGEVNGITVNRNIFGQVEGLPAQAEGIFYIVSALVANACSGRQDLLIPDDQVRDQEGRIIGCRAFARV